MKEFEVDIRILRDIGWSIWDPIGLKAMDMMDDAIDEYDNYLWEVAKALLRREKIQVCIDYMVEMETEYMGLSPREDTEIRATRTVQAIAAYVLGADFNSQEPSLH